MNNIDAGPMPNLICLEQRDEIYPLKPSKSREKSQLRLRKSRAKAMRA